MIRQPASENLENTIPFRELEAQLRQRAAAMREQRSAERLPLNTVVDLFEETDDEFLSLKCEAWALDLSVSGIGLLTEHPIEVGACFVVDFEMSENERYSGRVRIVYCTRLIGSMHRVGAMFID